MTENLNGLKITGKHFITLLKKVDQNYPSSNYFTLQLLATKVLLNRFFLALIRIHMFDFYYQTLYGNLNVIRLYLDESIYQRKNTNSGRMVSLSERRLMYVFYSWSKITYELSRRYDSTLALHIIRNTYQIERHKKIGL